MSQSLTGPVESNQNSERPFNNTSQQGPAAHEDLTIAEQIENMRVTGEHRPGEECFLDSHGEKHWVPTEDIRGFIRSFGAEHPSNYLAKHGISWEADFFSES